MRIQTDDQDIQTIDVRGGASSPTTIPDTAGRFRILKEIAHGGMGVVLRAWDPVLGREVAIKTLNAGELVDTSLANRIMKEIQIAARLQHPFIVPVHEFGELPDGRPFFVMSLVSGQTLHEMLAARLPMQSDLARFLKIFEQVCQAVAYAHVHGIIHLDLKPMNIMVGAFGEIRVLDWGVARVISESISLQGRDDIATTTDQGNLPESSSLDFTQGRVGEIFGTLAFMAPEQANGETSRLDQRTDVFALGAILCEILTRRPPYTGADRASLLRNVRRANLEEAFFKLDTCSAEREVVALAKRCLAADPDLRPKNANEVVAAVTAYLESDLRRVERDMVRFFDLTLDLCCIASLEGYFRRVNVNFSRVLGYTTEELLSQPFVEFVHPDDRESTIAEVNKMVDGLPVVCFRNRYRHLRGHYLWFEWTAQSIPEEGVCYAVARVIPDQVNVAT